ncbi:MAG: two-component sensor histidine kinase [Actinobacteria bacterium]|nr:two-component sensor histidine kinase [Actinomycetota bacterium]
MSQAAVLLLGLLAGVIGGAVVGGVVGARRSRRLGARRVDDELRASGLEHLTGGADPAAAVVRVVREVRRSAAEESRARALLVDVLDGLPPAIVLFDSAGVVVLSNSEGARMLGGRHGEAIVARVVRDLLATGGDRAVELAGPPARHVEIAMRVLADGHRVAVVDDVTERRRLEGIRRDFVANISHELRTPVGAIVVLTEAMIDQAEPAVLERLGAKVHREAVRVSEAIDDLIELSRLEHDAGLDVAPVLAASLVREAVGRVAHAAEERGIGFRCDVSGGVDEVLVDERQVVSALVNLLDNAVKYSPAGSVVTVGVRPCTTGAGARGVCFEVADEGIGIPARDLERIFERFYRVDRARSRSTGGIGLGLAIVRHVAQNHAGDIAVSSREGTGTTFTLRIPTPVDGPADHEETS